MKIDFECERRWWDAKADDEEFDKGDEAINRALRWREIERHLDGVRTILDVGGGTGAFSVPLARRGIAVTHVDLSAEMLGRARQKAEGLDNIRFVQGNAADLSSFDDASFDLVLNMDGAISFCGPQSQDALEEACRVARRTLIVTVFNRVWSPSYMIDASIKVHGRITPGVHAIVDRGHWHQDEFAENAGLARGCTNEHFPPFRAYYRQELRDALEAGGMQVLRCTGLGTLANFCGSEIVSMVQKDESLLAEFLDLCERFDQQVLPDGPGTRHRSGLIAVAQRVQPEVSS